MYRILDNQGIIANVHDVKFQWTEGKPMPIYMDRHNLEGATAKALADAHQKDLKLQDKFGIKLLTYWFDEARGSAFCLVDAPAKEKVIQT